MAFPLNEQQLAAVRALRGQVLISAGPGSGKTRTLTERFVGGLSQSDDEDWPAACVGQVLAITFTDKAAGELSERVRVALRSARREDEARAIDGAWISTIHGFCSRVLRRYALEAGLDPSFGVADTVETGTLKEQAFEAAARDVIGTPDGALLFGAFDFAAVFGATEALARELRTHGLGAEALVIEQVPDAPAVRSEAVHLFAEAGRAIAACGDSTASAVKQQSRCGDTGAALEALDAGALSNHALGEDVWRVLERWKPAQSTKKTAGVRETLKSEHARLLAAAATCAAEPFARALVVLVETYERGFVGLKEEASLLDFDDLQTRALTLFETRADIREQCRSQFRLVMVDEFQDTDGLQLHLVRAVAGSNLCTVGDERQSIYRFRGADIDVYRAHNEAMIAEGAREFRLVENYRSHVDLLSFVNVLFASQALFGENLLRLEYGRTERAEPLVPTSVPRLDVTLVHRVDRRDGSGPDPRSVEAAALAERLAVLRDEHGVRPGQMVVLLRAYTHADEYADALRSRGFEALVVGGSRFFEVAEVAVVRALNRVIANPHDEQALATVLASSSLSRLSDDALWILSNAGPDSGRGLWQTLAYAESVLGATDAAAAGVVRSAIERGRERAGRMGLSEVLLRAVEETGFDLALVAGGDQGRQGYANVLKLARMADAFEAAGGAGPAEFEAYLRAKEALKDHTSPATLAGEETPAVQIMSIHASKGLEFPVVAIPELGARDVSDTGLVRMRSGDGKVRIAVRLPSDWAANPGANRTTEFVTLDEAEKAADLEERKRLFYVACTRAEEMLLLSGSANFEKACDADAAKNPLDWMRVALGEALDPAGRGAQWDADIGPASARVSRVDADSWAPSSESPIPANGGGKTTFDEPAHGGTGELVHDPAVDTTASVRETHAALGWAASRLSYSDLGLFERCRLRFFAERVLRIGALDVSGPEDPRRFGSALHAVLQLACDDGALPGRERIAAIARVNGLDAEGESKLRAVAQRVVESKLALEIANQDSVRREWPFALQLGREDDEFLFVGTIDAYGRSGRVGLVVDYKTGESGRDEELAARYRLQARCYALAALKDGCESVRVAFIRPEVISADGQPQQVDFEFTSAAAAEIEAQISALRQQMLNSDFASLADWSDADCNDCPVAEALCPLPVTLRRTPAT